MAEIFAMVATAVTATSAVTIINSNLSAIHVLRSLTVCNVHTANTAAASILVTRGNTNSQFTVSVYTQVTCQQSIEVLSQPLVLNSSDTLKIACDPVDEVHAIASFLRIT
jgi:hypothetical protein